MACFRLHQTSVILNCTHSPCRNTREAHSFVPEDSIWSIFLQTALALEELHNCKILHRDVKPAVSLGEENANQTCMIGEKNQHLLKVSARSHGASHGHLVAA